jgi:hypothetical protein
MEIVKTYIPGLPVIDSTGAITERPALELMAVLTKDSSGLYAAYVALVPCHARKDDQLEASIHDKNADAVAHKGSKLRYNELAPYFRGIKESEYRA